MPIFPSNLHGLPREWALLIYTSSKNSKTVHGMVGIVRIQYIKIWPYVSPTHVWYSNFFHNHPTICTISEAIDKQKSRSTWTMVWVGGSVEIWAREDRTSPPHQGPPLAPDTHTLPMPNTLTTLHNLTRPGMGA